MEEQRGNLTPEQDALEHIIACKDKPFLRQQFIDSIKGRGMFTSKAIKKATFVVEYRGKIFSRSIRSEERGGDAVNGFRFEFSFKGERWCVDASKEDETLGRLVNDDHINPNCEMKQVVCDGKPHLCLFALKEIAPGKEITFNYGESSYEWRSKKFHSTLDSKRNSCSSSSAPRPRRSNKASISYREESSDSDCEEPGPSFHNVPASSNFAAQQSSPEIPESFRKPSEEDSPDESDPKKASEPQKDKQKCPKWSPNKKKLFIRRNHCYVCGKRPLKIARHLQNHSNEEPEIAEAFSFPPNSTERKRLLNILRNRGNYIHNQEVLRSNTGELKVKRGPKIGKTDSESYMHCLFYKDRTTRAENCKHKPETVTKESETAALANNSVVIEAEKSAQKIPSDVKKILSGMEQDKATLVIQNDLLIQLAKCLCRKHRNNSSKDHYIQEKLREIGTLLLELHNMTILTFEDAILPKNFSIVVRSVQNVVGFDPIKQTYSKQSIAFSLGNSLRRIANIILNGKNTSETVKSSAKKFIENCRQEWGGLVSDTNCASGSRHKISSPSTIPFTRDIQAFYTYLERLSACATESLKACENPQVYNALSRVTLTQVSILSKCTSEVSEMTLKSFEERGDSIKVLSKHFIRINIVSKSSLNTTALLTSQHISALTLLISKRVACGVHEENPFLFAKPDSSATSHYHGAHCIKTFSSLCNAENPENLRAAHLCKHMARIFQILNLENDELENLRELLGHDIQTKREYYRSTEAAVELAKISELLLAKENGSLDRLKGNSLEEVEIVDELKVDGELSSSDEDDENPNKDSASPPQKNDIAEQFDGDLTLAIQDAVKHIKAQRDKPFLQEKFIDSVKGRGLFTNESIAPFTFVVEFRGSISTCQERSEREPGDFLDNYVFNLTWNGTNWCIDASADDGSLGRFVNDNHFKPNCKALKINYEEKPHLCLFALKQISPCEEITFDYGESSYPWRSAKTTEDVNYPEKDSAEDPASLVDEKLEDSVAESFSSAASSGEEYVCNEQPDSDSSFSESKLPGPASSTPERDQTPCSSNDSDSDAPAKHTVSTRRHYCYVCGKPQSKISRHLFTHRMEDPEVAQAFALRRKSKERKKMLDKLRKRGNYNHNQELLSSQKEKQKVGKKSSTFSLKNCATCIYCKALFSHFNLWRHLLKCPARVSDTIEGQTEILALVANGLTEPENKIPGVRKMLKKLKEDKAGSLVSSDPYLKRLAHCLYYIKEGKRKDTDINRILRQMARLLIALKEKSIMSFEEALKVQNFDSIVEAVGKVSKIRKDINNTRLSKKMAYSLKKLANIKYAKALNDKSDNETIEEAKQFLALCEKEWTLRKRSVVVRREVPRAATLPFIQDVQMLFKYICNSMTSAVATLTKFPSPPVYNALLRVVVAYVTILNRNVAELSHMTVCSFQQRSENPPDADAQQQSFEEVLYKRMVKIYVANKVKKNIVLSLPPDLLSAITMLVESRKQCGLPDSNPYLFGKPDGLSLSVCSVTPTISSFVGLCGAKCGANLRSLAFHKHIARIFHILLLSNKELIQLATVLGRNIQTESEFYQNPEAAGDIAKILVLLSAIEDECLDKFQGKSLEEIDIPDELEAVAETSSKANKEESEVSLQTDGASPSSSKNKSKGSSKRSKTAESKKQNSEEDGTLQTGEMHEAEADELPEKTTEQGSGDASEETHNGETAARSETTAAPNKPNDCQIYFSDDDEDMHVDFNMDIDVDDEDVRCDYNSETNIEGQDKAEDVKTSETPMDDYSGETVDEMGAADEEERPEANADDEDNEAEPDEMDADSGGSSPVPTEKKSGNLEAAVRGMKEIKVSIRKLNVGNLDTPLRVSRLPQIDVQSKKEVPAPAAAEEQKPSSTSAEAVKMNCSQCKKVMMKGQTAYQKKGFTDVFCSKDCLFEWFPPNKAAQRICYYCFKEISEPLCLIMATVDLKGTMKDFCSPACLCSFKSCSELVKTRPSPQRALATTSTQTISTLCSSCSKTCVSELELRLDDFVHRFCSEDCLDAFCAEKLGVCENCGRSCRREPLRLRMEDGTRTMCGPECLEEFKKNITAAHECPVCLASQLPSDMVNHKTNGSLVDLFCSRYCVMSFKALPTSEQMVRTVRERPAETGDTARLVVGSEDASCGHCGKELKAASTVYRLKKATQVFCSESCVTEKHPHVQFDIKKCHNCLQLITQPQKMILAPADDSGAMMVLCSDVCLTAVKSRVPYSNCKLCGKHRPCKFSVIVDGETERLCTESCVSAFRAGNAPSWHSCAACGAVRRNVRLALQTAGGTRTVCGDGCLVKLKEKATTGEMCSTCGTQHLMSDMVESENSEGQLEFFCSHRCMTVHKAQSFTQPENTISEPKTEVKDVKPSLGSLPRIKEEPVDEEYIQNRSHSLSPQSIKEEPDVPKEDLKIESFFSPLDDSKPPWPTLATMDLPASCSTCQRPLMDGETVYQRKAHPDLFCSTSCLLRFYQRTSQGNSCHFCLRELVKRSSVLRATVDDEGTEREFCSRSCLSSFKYKRIMTTKVPVLRPASQTQCTVCNRFCISKHKVVLQSVTHQVCSDPCFRRFCNVNNLTLCENCGARCNSPLRLKMEDGSKTLCGAECLQLVKQKSPVLQPCTMCCVSKRMSDMLEGKTGGEQLELFCSNSCLVASKIQAVCSSGAPVSCDNCRKKSVPACHLAMPDASIRTFCFVTCAMTFKEMHKDEFARTSGGEFFTAANVDEPTETLPCAQCRQVIKSSPRVIQNKEKLIFVCSPACSLEFKRLNNILDVCKHCRKKTVIDEDGSFCSDSCFQLFRLEKKWGKHCSSCSFCLRVSEAVVSAEVGGSKKDFCSESCRSKYETLQRNEAACDACGRRGKMAESLRLPGNVKHFCDLRCLLRCSRKNPEETRRPTGTSALMPAGSLESSPVITSVVSLSDAVAGPDGLFSDIQSKVVGHAGAQTTSWELKNKSTLCVPLVHNKGVSCCVQTVETSSQTVNLKQKDRRLHSVPVPVPVYVPLPMNLYSQFAPAPLVLPVPLLVPVFLSKEAATEPPEEGKTSQEEEEREGEYRPEEETKSLIETINSYMDELGTDYQPSLDQKYLEPDCSLELFSRPAEVSGLNPNPHSSAFSIPAAGLVEETLGNKTKGENASEGKAGGKISHRGSAEATAQQPEDPGRESGVDAWRRWIQWRESQTSLPASAGTLKPDVLGCSSSELSDGLLLFISEVKRPDGDSYSPDRLFYLCLSIQQHLFENRRLENIFTDQTYQTFSAELTRILKSSPPLFSVRGRLRSCIEEEFLWGCKQLGTYSPIALLNTLLYFCCKAFSLTTAEQHRRLSFANLRSVIETGAEGSETSSLRFHPPESRRDAERDSDGIPAKKRRLSEDFLEMKENRENPLRCPVRLYEFYLSKCPVSVKQSHDVFYLQPEPRCVPSSPLWFSATPLDGATMEAALARCLAVRELQEGETKP